MVSVSALHQQQGLEVAMIQFYEPAAEMKGRQICAAISPQGSHIENMGITRLFQQAKELFFRLIIPRGHLLIVDHMEFPSNGVKRDCLLNSGICNNRRHSFRI